MNADFLKRVSLFKGLDDQQLAGILMLGRVREVEEGQLIFEEKSPGDRFYIIYDGAVRISKVLANVGEEALSILRAGDFFGEMSFFDELPRSARAVANARCHLLEIENSTLKAHFEEHPEVALRFLTAFGQTLSLRIRETNNKFSSLFTIARIF